MISAEEFLHALGRAEVLSDETIHELLQDTSAGGQSAVQLAQRLAGQGLVTSYQCREVLEGRGGKLVVAGYLLLDQIGAGGMGQVYLALHRQMQRRVAIKLMSERAAETAEAAERFRREIKIIARLSHPNIVAAYDAGEDQGMLYLVMEYVEGETLQALVKRRGPLPIDEAVDYLVQAARGLQAAHAAGIVHRDVKPSNLLRDNTGTVKLLDLGLARLGDPTHVATDPSARESLTRSDQLLGTIDYMAPEQACDGGRVDHRADIYSLGCCFYYFLTGRSAYDRGSVIECLLAHRDAAIPSLRQVRPDLPTSLDETFHRMVAKRPEDRFAAMSELLAAFGASHTQPGTAQSDDASAVALEAIAPFVPPVTPPKPAGADKSGCRRSRVWHVRTIMAVVTIVAFAALALTATLLVVGAGSGWFGGQPVASQEVARPDTAPAPVTGTVRAVTPLLTLSGHTNTIECLAFIPGSDRIVSGDDDQRLLVWDLTARQLDFSLAEGDDSGPCLAVAPDGHVAATASDHEVLKLWDLSRRQEVKRLAGHHVAFSPAGKLFAAALGDNQLALYDAADGTERGILVGHTSWVQALAFSGDGRTLASGDESGCLRVWDVEGQVQRCVLENGSRIHEVVVARDGSLAAAVCDDGMLRLWNVHEQRVQWKVPAHAGRALRIALSPDGARIATSGGDGTIAVWDVLSARELVRWPAHVGESVALAFSRDGHRLVSGGDDRLVKVWDVDALFARPDSNAAR